MDALRSILRRDTIYRSLTLVVLCTTSASFHGRDSRVSKKRQPDASFRSEKAGANRLLKLDGFKPVFSRGGC